jgi:hypothetical protein
MTTHLLIARHAHYRPAAIHTNAPGPSGGAAV